MGSTLTADESVRTSAVLVVVVANAREYSSLRRASLQPVPATADAGAGLGAAVGASEGRRR